MKRNLGFFFLGNGVSIADRGREINGEYEKVAHIGPDRVVRYYAKLSPEDKAIIEEYAKSANPSSSSSQPEKKVFRTESEG